MNNKYKIIKIYSYSNIHYRIIIIILLFNYSVIELINAQHLFHGMVTEAATGRPVEMATVQLLKGKDEGIISYTFTDHRGAFTLSSKQTYDSYRIIVSLLGYKSWEDLAWPDEALHIKLEEQTINLKEVEIRPGRVWGQRDTVNYDVTQFLTSRDESIKDVIKKLPGLDVDDLGRITYNGKDISNFYVEGMDLTDDRYGQIANNLDAKAVETVQLLENHQPIRILQDKIKTDNIALNLKLKPEFRSKWMLTLRGGLGASPFLREGSANVMRLSRKSQSAYIYKGDNTGKDVTDEQLRFFENYNGKLPEPEAVSFLSQPSIMAPLKKERLLFNDVHSLSANRLYRLNETTQLRLNTGYTHDVRRQERGSKTTYFQASDSIYIAEQSDSRIRTDQAEVSLNLENNADNYFLSNRFKMHSDWGGSTSLFTGNSPANQQIKTGDLGLRNDFRNLWNPGDYTFEARSLARYNHLPSELVVDNRCERHHLNHFYTDNSFSFIRKKGLVNHQYSAGIAGQVNNIKNGFNLYAIPSWQLNQTKWYGNLSLPMVWTNYPEGGISRVAVNPSATFHYKFNYAWRFSLSGSYREQYGDLLNFLSLPYQTDYRHAICGNGRLPVQRFRHYSVYGEYKRTVQEFFASLSLNHTRNGSNRIYEQLFEENQMILTSHQLSNRGDGWSLRGTISKGFYNLGMKTSLDYQFSRNRGEQISKGERLPFTAGFMQFEPKISWSPSRYIEASYQSTFRYGGSTIGQDTHLSPLWNIIQKANVSYELFPFEVNLSADYYYNDVSRSQSVNAIFTDISFRFKHGRWLFEASATNLFNKKQYCYTEYTSLQSYSSWINIRGCEFLLAARYKF